MTVVLFSVLGLFLCFARLSAASLWSARCSFPLFFVGRDDSFFFRVFFFYPKAMDGPIGMALCVAFLPRHIARTIFVGFLFFFFSTDLFDDKRNDAAFARAARR